MKSLRLLYLAEDEWHGELSATVESGNFRGTGSAWFRIEQLRQFWQAASAYPILDGEEPSLAGGFWNDGGETLKQCHLSVRLSPHDLQGSVRVAVTLGTPAQTDDDADLHQTVTTRFRVNYGDIGRFCAEMGAMLEGRTEEATLEGTPT